jgi:predicted porin
VRYRFESKEKNEINNNEALNDALAVQEKQQFRFHIKYKLSLMLEAETRLEQSYFNTKNIAPSNGTLIYQDIKYKANGGKWTLSARLALFSIDDYDARIYSYEDNLPYTFTVPLYQNSGSRFYLMAKYQVTKKIKLFARYAQTKYNNINSIGSGLEQISGNTQSDLSMQLHLSF